jgi:hypothetical protein
VCVNEFNFDIERVNIYMMLGERARGKASESERERASSKQLIETGVGCVMR